ncbi:IclR family transcriptional regulator [Streptomyces sp. NPDC020917]|uniref:IclR family transcriptional regulator n=1 Tax=Streptomyces sp. NPDC020917 TaxID=3365102 RepID=UPI0037AA95EF
MSNALDRGLDVLEILARRGEARVADLVNDLDVSRATAFRIMVTLEGRGFVEHVPERRTWRLGRAISELAAAVDSDDITKVAATTLADLAERTQETVNLATVHRSRVVWVDTIDSPHALRMTTTLGENVAIHATAAGKAILTAVPDGEWHRLLPAEPFPAFTPNTPTSMEALRIEVQRAKERGWALDDEECELNGVCVAAPILNGQGHPIAVISISSTSGRLPAERRVELGELVRDRCARLSTPLTGG